MKILVLIIVVCTLGHYSSMAQGIVRGKITDDNGETLIGATVLQKSNETHGTITDLDGNYSLEIKESTPQVLVISFISHQTVEDTVSFDGKNVLIQNYELKPATLQLDDVMIVGKANRSNDSYMKTVKMKSAVSLDYISKETIKKTGDSYVDDAVKRVTGVSTVAGFLTVRGLADRYIKTTINGSVIPTLNPLTNNIRLDMFPTSLIDNIVINKTQSPDLPGDWTGAYLSIDTKDYPQKLMVNLKVSAGYTPNTTFKNVISSEKGPTDWLGYDNGYRDIDHSNFTEYIYSPTMYQELEAMGYKGFLNSYGLNSSHLTEGAYNNLYRKIALIELQRLAPGYLNNDEEYLLAMNEYQDWDGPYKQDAWFILNTPSSEFGQSVPNTWFTNIQEAPLSYSYEFSVGNQVRLFRGDLGFIAGLRYSNSFKNDPDVEREFVKYDYAGDKYDFHGFFDQEMTVETVAWSALLSVSYKFNSNHSITLLYMPNLMGTNIAKRDSGYRDDSAYDFIREIKHIKSYNERHQIVYQYKSRHYLPNIRTKIELDASFTDGQGSTPDQKEFYYGAPGNLETGDLTYQEGVYQLGASYMPERTFSYLDEDILDAHGSIEVPLGNKPGFIRKFKFGAAYLYQTRETKKYQYFVHGLKSKLSRNFREVLSPDSFAMVYNEIPGGNDYSLPIYYEDNNITTNFSTGYTKILSGYALIDYSVLSWLRIAGGLRIENTNILSDITEYYQLGYPKNDPLRIYPPTTGAVPGGGPDIANPGEIAGINYLPSANIIFKLFESEKVLLNTRLNYSKTIARPSVVEISPFYYYDIEFQNYIIGNPLLKMSLIDNYDLRFESYFESSEFISMSLFYKDFADPIEMQSGAYYTWFNALYGRAYGIELEGKKQIVKNLMIGANITLINSHTEFEVYDIQGELQDTIGRAMFGQAPYIVNGLLDYNSEKFGLVVALSYNIQGPKVALAGPNNDVPDIVELPRHMLDFKIAKTIGKHFEIELKIRNILNESSIRAYDYENYKYTYDSYTFGTSYIFSIAYKL